MAEPAEEERQIEGLYASIGRIAVLAEHLSHAMAQCCIMLLRGRNEENELVETALAGHNLESMRRVWVAMMKLHFRGDAATSGMIDHLSNRIDRVAQRRNDTIHRLWFIGFRSENDPSFEVAKSMKYKRDISERGQGSMRVSERDSQDFAEIITELETLTQLIFHFAICIAFDSPPGSKLAYEDGKLVRLPSGSIASAFSAQ